MAELVKKELVLGYSPYGFHGTISPFKSTFARGKDVKADGFDGIDCMAFWGGEDIPPEYYKQERHPWNGAANPPSERDVFEKKAMLYCRAKNIPMLGICRGAQFLCAGAGGSLIQHMEGHGHDHHIDTLHKQRIKVTSTHHQMMFPYAVPHVLIGWADPPRASKYEGAHGALVVDMMKKQEAEIVYFPGIRALAIQGHPEYHHATTEFSTYCNKLINEFLLPPF
jgi:anthranilate/para-aminobenzoate synthase component II